MSKLLKTYIPKLCPKCYYLGRGQKRFLDKLIPNGNLILAAATIFVFLYRMTFKIDESIVEVSDWTIGPFLFSIYTIALVLYLIIITISGSNTCPNCNYKGMISVDNPEAVKLIKEKEIKLELDKAKYEVKETQS